MSAIAAISTPNAAGGIGIIRISGENAINIAEKCFFAFSGKKLSDMKGYTAAYGMIRDGETDLDEAVAIVYRAPKSYTGENTVELCCHGGLYVTQRVLRTVFSNGAVPAEAGEFTKRAFLNGKIDLSQAESVMSLIYANGEAALSAARSTLEGSIGKKINSVCSELIDAAAALEAWADYPDEDIPEMQNGELLNILDKADFEISALMRNYDSGRAVTEGVSTVICGKPNVGKSTLMNIFAGCQRSIVSPLAGTTRDVVEETVRIGDIVLRLADTAGIRETPDELEGLGVELAMRRLDSAGLVLAVFDSSEPLSREDIELLRLCSSKRSLAIINKTDLECKINADEIKKYIPELVFLSAVNEADAEKLKKPLEKLLGTSQADFSQGILTAERQYVCCAKALEDIRQAKAAITTGLTPDAVNVSLDCAVNELLELTGKKANEEIVNSIFSKFCVGK